MRFTKLITVSPMHCKENKNVQHRTRFGTTGGILSRWHNSILSLEDYSEGMIYMVAIHLVGIHLRFTCAK